MGLAFTSVQFEGEAPRLDRIAEEITRITDQRIHIKNVNDTSADSLHQFRAEISFAGFPETRLEIYSYRPGRVQQHLKQSGLADSPIANNVEGASEPAGTQTVHITGYIGQELTLLFAAKAALEALGGSSNDPMSEEDRRQFAVPITDSQIRRRIRKSRRNAQLGLLIGIIMFPIWLICIIPYTMITLPFRIWRAHRVVQGHFRNAT